MKIHPDTRSPVRDGDRMILIKMCPGIKHLKQGCLKFKDKTLRKLQWLVVGRYMRPMKVQFVQFTLEIFRRPESNVFRFLLWVFFFPKGWHYVAGSRYFNLDDCWAKSRKEDGTLVADQARIWC